MKRKIDISKYAICPYYKGETGSKVVCNYRECINIHMTFGMRDVCYAHKRSFCRDSNYTECPVYQMIDSEKGGE